MYPQKDKRRPRVLMDAKKRHGASVIDGNENAHFCTRTGCSGRIKYAPNSNIRSHYHSSASTSTSVVMNARKSSPDSKRRLPSQLTYAHSNSSLSTDSETASSTRSLSENKGELQEISLPKRKISIATSARKPCRKNQGASLVSSTPSVPSRGSDLKLSNSSSGTGARLDHRNLKSNSTSGYPGSYSSRGSKSFGNSSMKKSSADAESSSSRIGEKTVSNSTTTISNLRNKGNSSSNRRGSSSLSSGDKMPSVSTRRRPPSQNEGSHSYVAMPRKSTGQMLGASNSSSYSLPREYRGREPTTMPPSRTLGAVRFTPSMNRDLLHHYGINGSAEMLLALERIEQDEDMTPEQMLLEIGIFLSNITLSDQHQDMRLDIDNMSYEELLALEERMGFVSTPLSQEELSKCLKRSVYQQTSTPQPEGSSGINLDDTKCSICQEDYMIRDKIGVLSKCCHQYHETCISQWLRLKNWCPICKAFASTSPPSSSL